MTQPAIPPHLAALAALGVRRTFGRHDVLIQEGQQKDEIFIILTGRVEVYATAEVVHADSVETKKMVIVEHGPGQYVGEMSLDGEPRSASVRALVPTTCAMVTRHTVRDYIIAHPDFGLDLLMEMIGRLRRATDFLKSISLLEVAPRIEFLLKYLARKNGHWAITQPLTRESIAKQVGASRAATSEVVKQLEAEGALDFGARPIRLLGRLAAELDRST